MGTGESEFLRQLRAAPDDEATRAEYVRWLSARDDPRAEFVRADADLRRHPRDAADRSAAQERVRSLGRPLDPAWLAVVARCSFPSFRTCAVLVRSLYKPTSDRLVVEAVSGAESEHLGIFELPSAVVPAELWTIGSTFEILLRFDDPAQRGHDLLAIQATGWLRFLDPPVPKWADGERIRG